MTDRVVDYLDLVDRVQALIAGHPNATRVSLMLKPPDLELEPGEILIEQRDSEGARALRPHQLGHPVAAHIARPTAPGAQAAVSLASRVWTAVLRTGGPRPSSLAWTHLPGFFDPEELQRLPLPIGERLQPDQTVALGGHRVQFERPETREALSAAYRREPRTRLYEVVNIRSDGAWSMIALFLAQLSGYEVDTSIYESVASDATLGLHFDDWHGVVIQYEGRKRWALRTDVAAEPTHVEMNAGDLLVIPKGVLHDLTTPTDPGYSRHVTIAIETSHPPLRSRSTTA